MALVSVTKAINHYWVDIGSFWNTFPQNFQDLFRKHQFTSI